jgi:hypothetical protein
MIGHSGLDTRVATRTSSIYAGSVPVLRDAARFWTMRAMPDAPKIDHAKLKRILVEQTGPGKTWTRRGLSMAASDGKNPDLVRDIMRVDKRETGFDNIAAIAKVLKMDVSEFVAGPIGEGAPGPVRLQVRSIVEAGVWREYDELPPDEWYWVTFEDEPVTGTLIAARVEGRSMDLRFPHGTDLELILLIGSEEVVEPGDYVLVERRRDGLCEKTVKRIEQRADGNWELVAESTLPEFQTPMFIGKPDFYAETDDEIRVVAKVRNSKQSFVKRRRIPVLTV